MRGQPYPYQLLTRVSRAEMVRLRTLARALPDLADPRVLSEAAALLGAQAGVRARPPELLASEALRASLSEPLCALSLELEGETRPWPLWLELPLATAAVLVDRMLGGDGRAAPVPGRALDELSAGVLAYLAARLCAAASDRGVRVRAVENSRDAYLPVMASGPFLVWPLELSLDGARLAVARVLIPERSAAALPRLCATGGGNAPAAIADLTIALCAHAGRLRLTRGELAQLEPGDALIPERCALIRAPGGGYRGELELHAIGSRHGFSCRLDGTTLALEQASHLGEGPMTDTKLSPAASSGADQLTADVPIELCLELARFSLPLREISALRPGEVLGTGSPIGAVVTLSASGKPLARGELVDVDGEIGMRVLELIRG